MNYFFFKLMIKTRYYIKGNNLKILKVQTIFLTLQL